MGELVILHPQNYFKDPADNMLHTTPTKSHRKVKFNHDTNIRRQKPSKRIPRKNHPDAVVNKSVTTASKNLVIGQVKILKRDEPLEESSRILKENDLVSNREVSKVVITGGIVLPSKNKTTAKHKMLSSSTHGLGSNTEIVKNKSEFFAGYGFGDSPSPSLVPLPRFFINNSL